MNSENATPQLQLDPPLQRPTVDKALSTLGRRAPIPGGSADERMLRAIKHHAEAEADSLAAYQEMAETDRDPVVRLLMGLVVEDEERHHNLLQRIAASLSDDLNWTRSTEALPTSPLRHNAESTVTMDALRSYIAHERDSYHHMHSLARQLSTVHDGLFTLLLESMALDSQRHERILRFVLRRIGSTE